MYMLACMHACNQQVSDIFLSAAPVGEVVRAETLALVTIVRWEC